MYINHLPISMGQPIRPPTQFIDGTLHPKILHYAATGLGTYTTKVVRENVDFKQLINVREKLLTLQDVILHIYTDIFCST